ncbi:MAG: pilus assembly protein [Alphaproteobacteria bacterium]|nr:pilus assembly protein [Alphaproteobacteria bacterium]
MRDRTRHGVAAIEFALTLPIWVALLLGSADGSYYLLVNEKCDRIAYTVTDIVTQYQVITLANLNDILLAAQQLMNPFTFGNNGVVIVSSVFQPPSGPPIVEWQYSGGGNLTETSAIGTMGGPATLPAGLTLNSNDNVIISEVYYKFTPMFVNSGLFGAKTIYREAVYKPRLSPLVTPPS